MDISLLIVIAFLLAYIVYSDVQNRAERERLSLKLMSKDIKEYKDVTEEAPKETKKEEDPYLEMDEIDADKLLAAKE